MIERKRTFALRDAAALSREADRIRELCEKYVAEHSSVPPKPT